TNKCLATHKDSGREKLFESKTEFNNWLKEQDGKWKKEDFEFETISEIAGEPRFAFHAMKQKVDKIIHATGIDDYKLFIEGEGNFRMDYDAKYVKYKSSRPAKPLLFQDCREFFLKKYKGKVEEAK